MVGDLLLDRGVRKKIEKLGLSEILNDVKVVFKSADYSIANIECPITLINKPLHKKYIFRAEPSYLSDIFDLGITHLNVANNHTIDQDREGFASTIENIKKYKLIPLGYGKSQEYAIKPIIITKNEIKIAIFSSMQLPIQGWNSQKDLIGPCEANIFELKYAIENYKKGNPTHKILVILHWGIELQQLPTTKQKDDAKMLIDAGVDIIIGHHPHVVQSIEIYKNKFIFYSIGNFLFDMNLKLTRYNIILKLIFNNKDLEKVFIYPFISKNIILKNMSKTEKQDFIDYLKNISPNVKIIDKNNYLEVNII